MQIKIKHGPFLPESSVEFEQYIREHLQWASCGEYTGVIEGLEYEVKELRSKLASILDAILTDEQKLKVAKILADYGEEISL